MLIVVGGHAFCGAVVTSGECDLALAGGVTVMAILWGIRGVQPAGSLHETVGARCTRVLRTVLHGRKARVSWYWSGWPMPGAWDIRSRRCCGVRR